MDSYSVTVTPGARRDLRALPRADLRRSVRRIDALASDPRTPGCQKLADNMGYRIRQGNYRILYTVNDEAHQISVYRIGHRREVYR